MSPTGQRLDSVQISDSGDYLSLLSRPDGLYGFHHLEYPQPASSELLQLTQNQVTGQLMIKSVTHMDWSAHGGLWSPCAASITP
jgi:hypothetical protein